jgi:SAM domain (Sterile alpha motif)
MQEIADWLKKLGMSEYAERFVENRTDLSVLPELTDPVRFGVACKFQPPPPPAPIVVKYRSTKVPSRSRPNTAPVAGFRPFFQVQNLNIMNQISDSSH